MQTRLSHILKVTGIVTFLYHIFIYRHRLKKTHEHLNLWVTHLVGVPAVWRAWVHAHLKGQWLRERRKSQMKGGDRVLGEQCCNGSPTRFQSKTVVSSNMKINTLTF